MAIKIDLFSLWNEKEKELGRKITVLEVSKATGISRNTIRSYLKENNLERTETKVIDNLCQFFNVPPGPVPFLVYEKD